MRTHQDFAAHWAEEIERAQQQPTETIGGKEYPRVRYGEDYPEAAARCRDCGVGRGQFHVDRCLVERCAKCRGQARGCNCAEATVH